MLISNTVSHYNNLYLHVNLCDVDVSELLGATFFSGVHILSIVPCSTCMLLLFPGIVEDVTD